MRISAAVVVLVFGSLIGRAVASAADSAKTTCESDLMKIARNENGTGWKTDSARLVADATATGSGTERKTKIDAVISCLETEIETESKATGKQKTTVGANVRLLQSIKASLKLLETEADLYDLHVETYAATVFSNLYREKPSDSYFSKSRPFLDFEISQVVTGDRALEAFGNIGFQGTAAVTESNAMETIQKSNSFFADAGIIFFPNLLACTSTQRGNIGVGAVGDVGFVAVPQEPAPAQGGGATTSVSDSFNPTYRLGVIVRQLSGHWRGSFTEYAWLHDPRFDHKDRTWVRGRLRFGRENSDNEGHGLSSFLEGSVNIGKGKDEARIIVGVGLDTEKILKAILGLGSSQKENSYSQQPAQGKEK